MSPPESDAPGVIAPLPVIYLGFLGVGLVLDYLIPILLAMHQGVILREERHLERTFGEE